MAVFSYTAVSVKAARDITQGCSPQCHTSVAAVQSCSGTRVPQGSWTSTLKHPLHQQGMQTGVCSFYNCFLCI